jgi:isoleucyl-tRNA synthetase
LELFDPSLEKQWEAMIDLRDEVMKALEVARKEKRIGNSLSAHVHLYPSHASGILLRQFTDLHKLFIVSAVSVHDHRAPEAAMQLKGIAVQVEVASGQKCERCWNVTSEVGTHTEYPTLCDRCTTVILS